MCMKFVAIIAIGRNTKYCNYAGCEVVCTCRAHVLAVATQVFYFCVNKYELNGRVSVSRGPQK